MSLIGAVTAVFASMLVLALATGGIMLMVSPKHGRELLKNVAVAAILYFFGKVLLTSACSHTRPQPSTKSAYEHCL